MKTTMNKIAAGAIFYAYPVIVAIAYVIVSSWLVVSAYQPPEFSSFMAYYICIGFPLQIIVGAIGGAIFMDCYKSFIRNIIFRMENKKEA